MHRYPSVNKHNRRSSHNLVDRLIAKMASRRHNLPLPLQLADKLLTLSIFPDCCTAFPDLLVAGRAATYKENHVYP